MLVYLGLAEHLRVPWLVWENVPGVLSSNGGRDFGTFLGALGQLNYQFAVRVLDAQYFGVPQRRRRVFVVASLDDRPHPAKVLFEPESLRGDSAKGGKARKGSPRGARPSAESGGRVGVDIVGTLCSDTHPGAYSGQDAYTGRLVPQFFDEQASGSQYGTSGVASTCSTRDHKDAMDLVVTATGPVTHALTVSDGSEDGTGRGTPIVPVAFNIYPSSGQGADLQATATDIANAVTVTEFERMTDRGTRIVTGTLSSRSSAGGGLGTDFEVAGGLQAVGFDPTGSTANEGIEVAPTLRGSGVAGNAGHHAAAMTPTMQVRRLLPVECERLQGFPDDHTLIPWKKKPASECPDGPRYKAMGNSFAVPVVRWIGTRLDALVKGTL
jgi:DNA (cytosine-5)-methyltransferase 1